MKAIRVEEQGGPEVMVYQDFELPPPAPGQVQIKQEAIGVNFRDIYQRSGEYPMKLPYTPGTEGAGTITALGDGVADFSIGDRVGYYGALGAYAEMTNVPARRVINLPDDCSLESAAAVMGQGTTAHYLVHSCYPLKEGETCLVHAAAGGLGLLMVQMAKRLGATVIGTVSTDAKAEAAKAAGCDDVIIYTQQDFEAEVKRITGDAGVHVVLRQCRQDHLRPEPSVPKAQGLPRSLRSVQRPGTPLQPPGAQLSRFPLPDPTLGRRLFLDPRRARMAPKRRSIVGRLRRT